jgi:endonuclease YncB( thermonuclease family)
MESPLTPGVAYPFTLIRCIDGDTLRAQIPGTLFGTYTGNIRLIGINAPERKRRTRAAGDRAFLYLQQLVSGADLSVIGSGTQLDRYGRILGTVTATAAEEGEPGYGGSIDLASQLVTTGHAVPLYV